jgi:hypothetical protein
LKSVKTVSFSKIGQKKEQVTEEQKTTSRNKEKLSYTAADIQSAYESYVLLLEKEGKMGLRAVLKLIDASFQTDVLKLKGIKQHMLAIEEVRQDMMQYLRDKLQQSNIQLELEEIKDLGGAKKAYSNKDKFEEMVKKNPLLKEFKDKLDLDLN